VLRDDISARNAQVHAAFADEGGYICRREEDEGDGVVLDEGDVEAVFAAELYVGAGEEVESSLLEAALCARESGLADGRKKTGSK
jgi:hypothetical protein